MMQELLEFPLSDQLVQMIPQIPAVLGSVSLVLVVVAIETLIALMGFPAILFGHLKNDQFLIFSNT